MHSGEYLFYADDKSILIINGEGLLFVVGRDW
jgi:hypothetical protein